MYLVGTLQGDLSPASWRLREGAGKLESSPVLRAFWPALCALPLVLRTAFAPFLSSFLTSLLTTFGTFTITLGTFVGWMRGGRRVT